MSRGLRTIRRTFPQTHKALGWAKALQGDTFNAFRHLKHASELADTNSWKVVAACDRAYLARSFDEHRWSRIELDEAERLAEEVDWNATRGQERMGLLLLAQLFSTLDGAKASMYLARYRELGDIKLDARSPPRRASCGLRTIFGRYGRHCTRQSQTRC